MRDMSSIASTARLPRRFHLGGAASILAPTDRPYVPAVMSSDGGAFIRDGSAAASDYFSRLAGVADYGSRVPMDMKERVLPGGRG